MSLIIALLTLALVGLASPKNTFQKSMEADLIPLSEERDTVLVFMGYIGCADVCPPALSAIASFRNHQSHIPIYWINLTQGFDQKTVTQFAESLGMKGVQPTSFSQVQDFARKLGERVYRAPLSSSEIVHSGHFYRFTKNNTGWSADKVLKTSSPTQEQFLNFITD